MSTPLEATNRASTEFETTTRNPPAIDRQLLPHRIERTQLEATIAALERELRASERRRQDVIDQYERLLERRGRGEGEASNGDSDDGSSDHGMGDRSSLRRLFRLGRR